MIYIFDFEVTAYDWLLVAKELDSDDYFIAHNDNDSVKEFIENLRPLLGGFNNKHYDQFILKAILADATPEQVKEINDFIIVEGHNGWEHPIIKESRCYFDQFDLKDDCEQGVSLKSFEAHMGMNIVESSVDFNIDRPLTNDELQEMIRYCKYDVQATEKLYHIRESYLNNKEYLGGLKGIPKSKALYMTNAKLTAAYLGAEAKEHNDEREYVYPDNLLKEYIPPAVFEFFDRLHDDTLTDDEIFKSKYDFSIGDCLCTVGFGGIHGCVKNYRWEAINNEDDT